MKTYISTLFIAFILCTGCQQEAENPEVVSNDEPVVQLTQSWVLADGLDRPESAMYDAVHEVIFVSNLVGEGDGMDGVGYISKIGLDGSIVEQEWVSGLNAPKGLTLNNGLLYSTDINVLVEINPESGAIQNRYEVEGDVYLNDVAAHSDGSLFVTDSRYSKLYQFKDGMLTVWLEEHESVQMPNGAHVVGDELWVVAGDATADNPGAARYLKAISLADQSVRPVKGTEPEGALDAVEPDGEGGIFVTDWLSGRLMYFNQDQGLTLLEQLGQGAADVDYVQDTGMLYVPVMQEGQLIAYTVN